MLSSHIATRFLDPAAASTTTCVHTSVAAVSTSSQFLSLRLTRSNLSCRLPCSDVRLAGALGWLLASVLNLQGQGSHVA